MAGSAVFVVTHLSTSLNPRAHKCRDRERKGGPQVAPETSALVTAISATPIQLAERTGVAPGVTDKTLVRLTSLGLSGSLPFHEVNCGHGRRSQSHRRTGPQSPHPGTERSSQLGWGDVPASACLCGILQGVVAEGTQLGGNFISSCITENSA